ncbi:MAG: ATP-binding protein [Candidatus Kapaibacterium sp.]
MIKKIFPLLLIFFCFTTVYSQDGDRRVVIDSVLVNGIKASPGSGRIVLSSTDTISFFYSLSAPGNVSRNEFFFRTVLSTPKDSSVKVHGSPNSTYRSLYENDYSFSIGAFDRAGTWNAGTADINFLVDNEYRSTIDSMNRLQDSLAVKNEILGNIEAGTEFDLLSGLAGLLIGIALVFGLIMIFKPKQTKPETNISEEEMGKNNKIEAQQMDKLKIENSNLRAEIAALRGQIDAMQARGQELRKQNNILQDNVTKLSSINEELQELQKQKDELFAVIIHDIKNPVSLIKSLVELLRSYDLTSSEQNDIINDIATTTVRIVSLSHEVSRILALEGSSMHLDINEFQVSTVVRDVFRRNSIHADNKDIKMLLDVDENLPLIEADMQKIDEITDNLLSNAIKFTQKGGTVKVSTYQKEKRVVVEISDNGLGLSEDDIKQAFQRGARLSAQPTGNESSTGLGLWIVKKLVEAHQGRVWVKSALGKGSSFAFELPLKFEDEDVAKQD